MIRIKLFELGFESSHRIDYVANSNSLGLRLYTGEIFKIAHA